LKRLNINRRLRAIFPKVPRDIIEDAVSHTLEICVREKKETVIFSVAVARNYIVNRLRYESKFVSWDDVLLEGRRELLCHISDAAIDFDLIVKKNFQSVEYNAIFDFVMGGSTLRELAKDHPPAEQVELAKVFDVLRPAPAQKEVDRLWAQVQLWPQINP